MGKKQLLDADGGVIQTLTYDDAEKTTTIETIQDVDPILENNKRLQSLNDGYSPSRELRRVASVPHVVILDWCKKDGIPFRDFIRNWRRNPAYKSWFFRKLHDADNRAFLTAPRWSNRYVPGAKIQ